MQLLTITPELDSWIANGTLADTNNGSASHVAIGNAFPLSVNLRQRGLCRFTLPPAQVPSTAVVARARLVLTKATGSGALSQARAFNVYELTRDDWTSAGVTYNKYDGTNNWAAAGGDFISDGAAVLTINPADSLYTFDVTDLVRRAVELREGVASWIILGTEDTGANDWIDVRSSEYGTAAERPTLLVEYFIPEPAPAGPLMVPMWKLATLLAACPSVQQRLGFDSGDEFAQISALERIAYPTLEDELLREQLPAIVISEGDNFELALASGGARNYLRPNGSLAVIFADNSRYAQQSLEQGKRDFCNWVGAVLREMEQQAAVDTSLAINRIRQEMPATACSREEEVSSGSAWFVASYLVDWS